MMRGARAVAAARAAIGTRFRLHGRDAAGLDCVGLVALALRAEGFAGAVPSGYRLRSGDVARVRDALRGMGLVEGPVVAGGVLLLRPDAGQLHLGIATRDGMIHADAMLGRVVERPDRPWPVLGCWQLKGE